MVQSAFVLEVSCLLGVDMGLQVVRGIVNMNESAIYDGHSLKEVRNDLAEVVAVLERHVGREDDVDLDEELVSCVICAEVLNLLDGSGEAHGEVEDLKGD